MDISTDFIPKPGDRIRYKSPTGKLTLYIWVICPTCLRGRWISISSFNLLTFTGLCKDCHTAKAKNKGWWKAGKIVET